MQYPKFTNIVVALLLALSSMTAFAAQGQGGENREFRKHKHFRCADNEAEKMCQRRFRKFKWEDESERRKHIRRMTIQRDGYEYYGRRKYQNYHPVSNPYGGSGKRLGKGRLTEEQREELRRMINEVNQERRYKEAR